MQTFPIPPTLKLSKKGITILVRLSGITALKCPDQVYDKKKENEEGAKEVNKNGKGQGQMRSEEKKCQQKQMALRNR
jgi:hypothetical protein